MTVWTTLRVGLNRDGRVGLGHDRLDDALPLLRQQVQAELRHAGEGRTVVPGGAEAQQRRAVEFRGVADVVSQP